MIDGRGIYLDMLATTPVDPAVAAVMHSALTDTGDFGNPASRSHSFGWQAQHRIDEAASMVAEAIGATAREIVWTSGATEANNLAIKGAMDFYHRKGRHIVTTAIEHKAVLDPCHYLAQRGYDLTVVPVLPSGRVDLDALAAAIRRDTVLVSMMHVNNETGVIQDIAAASAMAHRHGALFHTDAAQSIGKLPIDVREMGIDFLSASAHKCYGPKGVGALFVSRQPRVRLTPSIHGGADQHHLRAGTLPTHQIVGMGAAVSTMAAARTADQAHRHVCLDVLWKGLSQLPGITQNGDVSWVLPGCLNVRIVGVDAQQLIGELDGIAVSTGSACNSASPEPSHVLTAMGLSHTEANESIRLSVGRTTTLDEAATASKVICRTIQAIRQRGSYWPSER